MRSLAVLLAPFLQVAPQPLVMSAHLANFRYWLQSAVPRQLKDGPLSPVTPTRAGFDPNIAVWDG